MFTPVQTTIGALLVAQATTTLLHHTNRPLGASGILGNPITNLPTLTGITLTALTATYFLPSLRPSYSTVPTALGPSTWPLAGFLVGFGTKLANGCTSGHMLCGVPRRSLRSVAASTTFFVTASLTAFLTAPAGNRDYTPTYPSAAELKPLLYILGATSALSLASLLPKRGSIPEDVISFYAGVVFALGLLVTGMADPVKPMGFLLARDPSLVMVVVGAVIPCAVGWWWFGVGEREVVGKGGVDARLVVGAAVFGVGWGVLGMCPGTGIVGGVLAGWRGAAWVGAFGGGYWLGGKEWWG